MLHEKEILKEVNLCSDNGKLNLEACGYSRFPLQVCNLKGNAVQINFKQLTLLCLNLNCTPNDLFVLRDMQLSQNHQLNNLRKMEDEIVNPFEQFKKMSLEEINKMIEE